MLIACGDALIDFVPTRNTEGREAVMPAVGGSCLNVAIGMARLGAPTGFVGGVSTDMFGRMIADHADRVERRAGASHPQRSPDHARLRAHRRGRVALRLLRCRDRDTELDLPARRNSVREYRGRPCRLDHAGERPGRGRDESADRGRAASSTISFDPNCRPNLVKRQAGLSRAHGRVRRPRRSHQDVGCRFRVSLRRRALSATRERAAGAGHEPRRHHPRQQRGHCLARGSRAGRSSGAEGRDRRHHRRRRQFSGCAPVRPAQAGPHQPAAAERHRRGRASPRAVLCRQLRRPDLYPPGRRSAVEP